MGLVDGLAVSVGLKTSMVRALLALICSLPVSHVLFFLPTSSLKHLYSVLSGCALCWLAYGAECE